MKKKFNNLIFLILFASLTACADYKPIFNASNINFEIVDYSLKGNDKLSNQIYLMLRNASKSNTNSLETKKIYLVVNTSKNKSSTAKDSAGKILGYKINLSTEVTIKNLSTGDMILSENLSFSSSYKVQTQYSETLKLENKSMDNLLDKTFQDLLIKLIEKI